MEFDRVLESSPVCLQIIFRTCLEGEIPLEILRILALQNQIEVYRSTSTKIVHDCLGFLERAGYVELEERPDEELEDCIREVSEKRDKRIKNPMKYCLKQKRGSVINIVKPSRETCFLLQEYYKSKGFILSWPRFKAGEY